MRAAALALGLCAGAAPAADELALGAQLADAGTQARVPVYVRDLPATLLNEGDGPDREIQSFAFQVQFPPAFVDAVSFVHAGVTAGRIAFFSQVTPGVDNLYVLKAFNENSDPLAFTLGATAPGDLIGEILIDIDSAAPPGSAITLTLQAFNAALIDASATESETVANGHLLLRHATLVVGPQQVFRNGFE
ncbi:MAG: hypothetical protein IT479_02085 [Xanthomonadales bacterium]|nr:hypothetical protein [Xanthomonadales bacterium]MCC6592039.1 hypothetical protein [Xanthomonadales bacterium]MCE7931423.1 hypothetical protein [Xanthomonadales bacterium PRO6]